MAPNRLWFTASAPGFDADEVEALVVSRMLERAPEGSAPPPKSDSVAEAFEESVASTREALDSLSVQVSVRDERLPVGNAFWNRVKAQFHALTVLYVNELAGRQAVINKGLVDSLEALNQRLNVELEQRDRRIDALEIENARLKDQLSKRSKRQD